MTYLIKKKLPLFAIRCIDRILELFYHSATIHRVEKLLLCNGAHLGDVIISTGILSPLREALKGCKIGFLCSSFSSCVLQDHPEITWVHKVDHWKLNRTRAPKISHYYKTKASALSEIKQIAYDAAIDLYPYFPNSIPLVWQAKIPVRIGYGSGGFGPLLTHRLTWEEKNQPLAHYQFALLHALTQQASPAQLQYSLPQPAYSQHLEGIGPYILFHTGSGSPKKDWHEEYWRKTASVLKNKTIVFTGKENLEKQRIQRITQGLSHCIDLCGKLSWKELSGAVQRATQVVTVDSAVAHLAETYHTPSIVIFMEDDTPTLWGPPHATILLRPCSEEVVSKISNI